MTAAMIARIRANSAPSTLASASRASYINCPTTTVIKICCIRRVINAVADMANTLANV